MNRSTPCSSRSGDWFPSGPGRVARAREAAEACGHCPLSEFESCRAAATQLLDQLGELHGVWAGQVFKLDAAKSQTSHAANTQRRFSTKP